MNNILGEVPFLRVLEKALGKTLLNQMFVVCLLGLTLGGCAQSSYRNADRTLQALNIGDHTESFWDPTLLPIILDVDVDLGPGIIENIELASREWNQVLGYTVFEINRFDIQDAIVYGILTDPPFGHVYIYSTELGRSPTREFILGLARRDINHGQIISGVIFVDDDLVSSNSYVVMLHELGHILGLSHDDSDFNSLMYPQPLEGSADIRADDILWIQQHLIGQD